MKRTLINDLIKWKDKENRKPLILLIKSKLKLKLVDVTIQQLFQEHVWLQKHFLPSLLQICLLEDLEQTIFCKNVIHFILLTH